MKVGSKWKCKISICIIAYSTKWLLTKHLKEVHGLIIEKAKHGKPLTSKGSPQHEDHAKMNARILGDAMVMQRRNDLMLMPKPNMSGLIIVAKQCAPLLKPTLIKLVLKQVLCLNGRGKCASRCNMTDRKGRKFIKDDLIHLFYICTMIEDGMGC